MHATNFSGKTALEMAEDSEIISALIKHLIDHPDDPGLADDADRAAGGIAAEKAMIGDVNVDVEGDIDGGGADRGTAGGHEISTTPIPVNKKIKKGRGVDMFHFEAAMLKLSLTPGDGIQSGRVHLHARARFSSIGRQKDAQAG